MSKITQDQIQELYRFTRQHFVEHYDLQTELVDHMANDIESIWAEQPKLSFEDAKTQSFKKFGIFGFMDVIEHKQKALNKSYHNILWQYAKEWFQLPKIIVTLTIFFIVDFLLQLQIGVYIFLGLLFVLTTFQLIKSIKLRKEMKERFKTYKRKWMIEDIIFQIAYFNSFVLGANFLNIFHLLAKEPLSPIWALIVSTLFILALIYSYITLMILPSKADELLKELYPEYKII